MFRTLQPNNEWKLLYFQHDDVIQIQVYKLNSEFSE